MKVFLWTLLVLGIVVFAVLSNLGYRQGHRRDRASAEPAALSAALESYKYDHGKYPSEASSDRLRPDRDFSPSIYVDSSAFLYSMLSGGKDGKVYFEFSKNMLKTNSVGQIYIVDPHGNSYGYSTANLKNLSFSNTSGLGYFDLWSTGGGKTAKDRSHWVKNW